MKALIIDSTRKRRTTPTSPHRAYRDTERAPRIRPVHHGLASEAVLPGQRFDHGAILLSLIREEVFRTTARQY
jgi:hypothetical protein